MHTLYGESETAEFGARLARACQAYRGGVIYLLGGLGAGKTCFARGFLRQLGVTGRVPSPTYTLVEAYDCSPPVMHMDLYRLGGEDEIESLGLDDTPPDACWWLVEWPMRGGSRLAPADLIVNLDGVGDARTVELQARTELAHALLELLHKEH